VGLLQNSGWLTFGFWTPEIRQGRERRGFEVVLLSGTRETLASTDYSGPPRVGRYGVRTEVMERLVLPEIERGVSAAASRSNVVLVMDEIGKMELLSPAFAAAVLSVFDTAARVVATVMARPHPLADALKARPDVELVSVTLVNRERLATHVAGLLLGS